MPQTETKVLPLGKPRATKYLEIVEKRDGKRKRAQVEKRARELAAAADARVVRFEFVAEAAGVTLDQMASELAEHGIRTSPSNVRHGKLNGATKTKAPAKTTTKTAAAKAPAKDGPGNARKATTSKKASSPTTKASSTSGRAAKPDPKEKSGTGRGSKKPSGSSPTRAGSRGRAVGSSLSKSAQTRKLREQQVSTRS